MVRHRQAERGTPAGGEAGRRLVEGVRLHRAGRLEAARRAYEDALRLAPGSADAHHLLGLVAHQSGDQETAEALIRRALRLDGNDAGYHNSLGSVLLARDRPDAALRCFRRALVLNPDSAEAHTNLGNALMRLDDAAGAEASYRQALGRRPGYAVAHNNLGGALRRQGRLADALAAYDRALACDPAYAAALSNRGRVLAELGRPEDALADYERALAVDPGHAEAHANRATALLLLGRFAEGWEEYEWRWRTRGFTTPRRPFAEPLWDGAELVGRTILVHAEQGLGSAIQFVRYVPLVARRGGCVVLECQEPLQRLFASVDGVSRLVAKGEALPGFDVHVPMMSLPRLFATRLETIPATVPYLGADAGLVARWRERLSPLPTPRVGLVWAGNPRHDNDRNRSMPQAALAPLTASGAASFVSLQAGPGSAAAARLPPGPILDLAPQIGDFADTAAVVASLDLVISVDTAVAHLAGALARPVWLLLPFVPEWRWLLDRDDSPWYPTMRLFRQTAPGDWTGVVGSVGEALARGWR